MMAQYYKLSITYASYYNCIVFEINGLATNLFIIISINAFFYSGTKTSPRIIN